MQANPAQEVCLSFRGTPNPSQQVRKRWSVLWTIDIKRQIGSVGCQILRHQVDLDHSLTRQRFHFGGDRVDAPTPLRTPKLGNDAKSARTIAALGDLYIAKVAGLGGRSRRGVIVQIGRNRGDINHLITAANRSRNLGHFSRTEQVIDLRNLAVQLFRIALRQTASDHQPLTATALFERGHL